MTIMVVALLIFLLMMGVPIVWSFAASSALLVVFLDSNVASLMLQGFRSLNSVVLLALPLFILCGYVMQSAGISRRIIEFIDALVGRRKDGLGSAMVFSSGIFGAIAGTASAAVVSIGTIMLPALEERGYPSGYSAALLGISSLLGILIPPSITMILFGVVSQQSISALFAATLVPGALLMFGLIFFNKFAVYYLIDNKDGSSVSTSDSPVSKDRAALGAFPALLLPFSIVGGIYGGFFTPTEAAAVAVVIALTLGFFVYRELTLKKLFLDLAKASEVTGSIIFILLFSFMISRMLVFEGVPQEMASGITEFFSDPLVILLVLNAVLILVGMIMDDVSVTVVIAPLFLPLISEIGVDPVHYAAIVACSVVIGANSPPVSPVLYMSCKVGSVSVHEAIFPSILFILFVALPVMLLVTFIPQLSLFLPGVLGFS